MPDIVISAQGVGKRYKIGELLGYATFGERLNRCVTAPARCLRSLFKAAKKEAVDEGSQSIWALKDVSFTVNKGDIVGIIGRNGSGKTTLLKLLSRITEPTEGCAKIRGRISTLLEVGTGFHPELTGRENIYLNGAILGMRRAEMRKKFDEIVAFAEVDQFIDTPVKQYSSGMYVRLAFAVAAHLDPDILLVDEVLAVGDYTFQKKCIGRMSEVAKGGRTVLFVSHNMFSVQNLCNRVLLLESGRLAMDGEPGAVIGSYLAEAKGKNLEAVWDDLTSAPGDSRARLQAVRILQDGVVTTDVKIDKEFMIEATYRLLKPLPKIMVSMHINTGTGICVMTSANLPSMSHHADPYAMGPLGPGVYKTSCTIPGLLLNDGLHSINVYVSVNNLPSHTGGDTMVRIENVIAFDVVDTGAMRKEFTGKWLGAIRPRFDWQTKKVV